MRGTQRARRPSTEGEEHAPPARRNSSPTERRLSPTGKDEKVDALAVGEHITTVGLRKRFLNAFKLMCLPSKFTCPCFALGEDAGCNKTCVHKYNMATTQNGQTSTFSCSTHHERESRWLSQGVARDRRARQLETIAGDSIQTAGNTNPESRSLLPSSQGLLNQKDGGIHGLMNAQPEPLLEAEDTTPSIS